MNNEIIEIRTEYINLDNLLKFSGVVSTGGEAKVLILEEQVKVNDEVCTQRHKKIRDKDLVKVNGRIIEVRSLEGK